MPGSIVSQIVIFPKSFSPGDDIFRQNCHDSLDPNCAKTYILNLDRFAHPPEAKNVDRRAEDKSYTLKGMQNEFS